MLAEKGRKTSQREDSWRDLGVEKFSFLKKKTLKILFIIYIVLESILIVVVGTPPKFLPDPLPSARSPLLAHTYSLSSPLPNHCHWTHFQLRSVF